MNYKEFAKHVNVPHGTVKRWAHEGMPVNRGGRYPQIDLESALAWVHENKPDCISIDREGVVYFVLRDRDGAVKIGWSSDLERRLKELRKENGCALSVLAALPGDKTTEQGIHARFEHLNVDREWFKPAEDIQVWLRGLHDTVRPLTKASPRSPDQSPDWSPDPGVSASNVPSRCSVQKLR